MVLTNDEYQEAKSDPKLSSLFKLRNATKSYIIQCLADREIQYTVSDQQQRSKAFRHNCEVIHSPVKYVDVEAADGVGWNSTTCNPRKLRYLVADTKGEQSNEILKLKAHITKKDKRIANLKQDQTNHQNLVRDLKTANVRQSEKIQQLKALVSDKENITGLKYEALVLEASTRIRKLEKLVAAKDKTILDLKVSNERSHNELSNARKLVDNLLASKQEEIRLKENHQKLIRDLNAENIRQSEKIQQLTAIISDKEININGLKAEVSKALIRIQQMEAIVAAKEKTIFALKVSNERSQNELNNARKHVDSLKKEKEKLKLSIKNKEDRAKFDRIRQVDQYFEKHVFNNNSNPVKPACDGVPYNGRTSSDESSKINLRNSFVFAAICYVAYKNPESLIRLSRIISFYSLLSLRKMFTCSIFLVDIPLNMLATKDLFM